MADPDRRGVPAGRSGAADLCWDLAISVSTTFESRIYRADWRATHEVALAVTRQAGEPRARQRS